jgi:hypothetical protein
MSAAQQSNRRKIVTNEQNRASLFSDLAHFPKTLFPKFRIAREGAFHLSVEEPLDFGECHDFVELALNLQPCRSQNCAIEINLLPTGQFLMKFGCPPRAATQLFHEALRDPLSVP